MKRIIIIVIVLAGILYLADFLSVRFRIPARDTFGTVTLHTYYVVKLKNGRTEYDYAGDHNVSSVSGRLSLVPLSHTGPRHLWHRDIAYLLRRQVEEWKDRVRLRGRP